MVNRSLEDLSCANRPKIIRRDAYWWEGDYWREGVEGQVRVKGCFDYEAVADNEGAFIRCLQRYVTERFADGAWRRVGDPRASAIAQRIEVERG